MTDYFGAMGSALYSKLSGGTALTAQLGGTFVYAIQAPDLQALPYVIFSHQGGGQENINASGMRNNLWFVRGYGTSAAVANALDGLVDTLLNKQALTVTGATMFWCARETDLTLVENLPSGEKAHMAGALYRIRATGV